MTAVDEHTTLEPPDDDRPRSGPALPEEDLVPLRAESERASTMRDGLRVLGVGVRREPRVFTVAVLGSVLFGALTVADAWVLGWATTHAVVPSVRTGEVQSGALVAAVALFVGVSLVRAVGIIARRIGAGVMLLRMEAHHRRAVTRQYLRLPMSWHHRHPTGQLLSNANSDVEAAWSPLAPFPFALGVLAMMVVAVVQMLLTDLVMAMAGLLVFPAVLVANLVFQRKASPLMRRAQRLRAQVAEVAHETSTVPSWSRPWAASARRPSASAATPRTSRTPTSLPAACRPSSTPSWSSCPTSACWPCSSSASRG